MSLLGILGLGMAGLVGFLKTKFRPKDSPILWGDVVLSGLSALVGVALVLFALTGRAILAPSPITTDNAADHLKALLSQSGYTPNDEPDRANETHIFHFDFAKVWNGQATEMDVCIQKKPWSNSVRISTEAVNQTQITKLKGLKKGDPGRFNKLTEAIIIQTNSFTLDYWPDEKLDEQGWTPFAYVRIRDGMDDDFLETVQRVHLAALAIGKTIDDELAKQAKH